MKVLRQYSCGVSVGSNPQFLFRTLVWSTLLFLGTKVQAFPFGVGLSQRVSSLVTVKKCGPQPPRSFLASRCQGFPGLEAVQNDGDNNPERGEEMDDIMLEDTVSKNDDNEDGALSGSTLQEPEEPQKVYSEEEVGRQLMNRLTWASRLDGASYFVGILFLLSAYGLQLFGYSYLIDDNGRVRIDTIEARQFRDEMVRSKRQKIIEDRRSLRRNAEAQQTLEPEQDSLTTLLKDGVEKEGNDR